MIDIATHHRHPIRTPAPDGHPHTGPIAPGHAWRWLAMGWRDICTAPTVSLAYGIVAVVSSFVMVFGLAATHLHHLVLPMAAGFMLVGPLLAVGLYESSRLIESGERPTLPSVLGAYTRNAPQLAAIGLVLMLALLAWVRIALLIFAIFFAADPPALDVLIERIFFSAETVPFLLTGTAIGGVIATGVFAISAVSLPLLLDRDTDAFTAMATSVRVVRDHWRAMAVWAALIVLFTAAGIATGFIGLALSFPLIGHASWHCYRDVVGRQSGR